MVNGTMLELFVAGLVLNDVYTGKNNGYQIYYNPCRRMHWKGVADVVAFSSMDDLSGTACNLPAIF